MNRLDETVNRLLPPARAATESVRFGPDLSLSGGHERRTDPRAYDWDGARRGGDPRHPVVIVQYTLEGWGNFSAGGGGAVERVTPGHLFAAVIPSPHRYWLPAASPGWRFFFLMVRHPYAVERWRAAIDAYGHVTPADPDGPLAGKLLHLFAHLVRGSFRDQFDWELAVLDAALEFERAGRLARYPQSPRQTLLEDVRAQVLRRLGEKLDVETLAARRGTSRSNFSHAFKAATGQSPAHFVTEVRLQEAARRLLRTDDKLAEVARTCGFADANHFCKVFRRNYHTSPGEYRRQLR